jgi:hypothetical protein
VKDKLFEKLDDLNVSDTSRLLNKDITLSLAFSTRRHIEKAVMKKAGYCNINNKFSNKINNILGAILMKRKIALTLSMTIVLSLGGGGYAYAKAPVAYVSLDINPSVELGVNAFEQVVSVEAYNEDGEKVLEGTNLMNTNISDAVKTVISNAVSDGYIKGDDAITNDAADSTVTTSAAVEITVSTDKEKVATKLEESLKEVTNKVLEDNYIDAEVEADKVALARRDEAKQLGITPGKLNLIQKLQALDPTIKIEDYKTSSVKAIQKKVKELRKKNKNDDRTVGNNPDTDKNNNENIEINASNNTSVTSENNTSKEDVLLQSSIDSEKNEATASEKHNNFSDEKRNNSSIKKEENNLRKEEKGSTISEKKNDNGQENGNSWRSEKGNNDRSNSQGKGKNN